MRGLRVPSRGTGRWAGRNFPRGFGRGDPAVFLTTVDAATAARSILREFGDDLAGAIGLHAGPVRIGLHPVTVTTVVRGEHSAKSDDLAVLSPAGLIYASEAFAALLGLGGHHDSVAEFLGFRPLGDGGAREPIFQILP